MNNQSLMRTAAIAAAITVAHFGPHAFAQSPAKAGAGASEAPKAFVEASAVSFKGRNFVVTTDADGHKHFAFKVQAPASNAAAEVPPAPQPAQPVQQAQTTPLLVASAR